MSVKKINCVGWQALFLPIVPCKRSVSLFTSYCTGISSVMVRVREVPNVRSFTGLNLLPS